MKSNNRLESAGLCTHVGELLCVQRRCGMICFSKFFKFCAAAFFAIFCGLFCNIDSAYAVDYPFSVTTSSISSGGTFQFKMSAQGTFYVDCGTGGTLSGTGVSGNMILKSNTTNYTYTCTYSSAGSKTIRFGGAANGYNSGGAISFYTSAANAALIASVSGDLTSIFPYIGSSSGQYPSFAGTFSECTSLTSIPENLFNFGGNNVSGQDGMFSNTFSGCTGLTSIPANLFQRVTSGAEYLFYGTFWGCSGLTEIPSNLFNFGGNSVSGQRYMFAATFVGCTGLTSIPTNLFQRVTSGAQYLFQITFWGCTGLTSIPGNLFNFGGNNVSGQISMFDGTFKGCIGLTSIPGDLFQRITSGASGLFVSTFNGCTGLTSIPDTLFDFGGNNVSGQPNMFTYAFRDCVGLTSIPVNLFQRITSSAESLFLGTFSGCISIAGYIPPSTFAGLIANNHPTANYMWYDTFADTQLVTTCPADTSQYTTGYEGSNANTTWNGKVSCETVTYNVSYACGMGAGNPPSSTTATYNLPFTPAANTCTVPDGTFSGWLVSGTSDVKPAGTAFTWNYTEGKTLTAQYTWNTHTVTYSCREGSGNPPSSTTATYNSLFTFAANTCTPPSGKVFVSWVLSDTYDVYSPGTTILWQYTENKTVTAQYASDGESFSITTSSIGANGTFQFKLSAKGTFVVNCGNGGTLSGTGVSGNTITKSSTTEYTYTCTYSSAGEKTISFGGSGATDYNTGFLKPAITFNTSNANSALIAEVHGNLSELFPYISSSSGKYPVFYQTFNKCTRLKYLPDTLFADYTTTGESMFYNTFKASGLRALPEHLFSNITTNANNAFFGTFSQCSSLSGYIPPTLFSGLIANGSPGSMMSMFDLCYVLLTSCPEGTAQYITGYESDWNSHVSCEPAYTVTYSCGDGGGTAPAIATVTNNSSFTPATNTCTVPTGYTFGGWLVSGTSDVKPSGTAFAWNYDTDKTLTAQYTGNTYNVTYACGVGGGTAPSGTSATYGSSFTPASNTCTVPTGYSFSRWRVSGTNDVKLQGSAFTWNYTEDKTFTAEYSARGFQVMYSCGSGTGDAPDFTTAIYDSSFTPATNTCNVPAGYTFSGWLVSGTSDVRPAGTEFTWNYTGTKTLTAQYTANTYPVSYACGSGGGNAPSNTTATYDSSFTPATNTCNVPAGYTFSGWLVSGTSDVKTAGTGFTWNYTENKTLTAQYTVNTYTVTYACGTGDGNPPSGTTATYGTSFTVASNTCTPPAGYRFSRWSVSGTNDIKMAGEEFTWEYTENKTLTAQYNANIYSVSYDCNGTGGSIPVSTSVIYDAPFTTAENGCNVPFGYQFSGWLVSGTNDVKPANTEFTWNYAGNKTLTAQYTANTYPVSYACGSGGGNAPSNTTATYDSSFTPAANTCTVPTGHTFSGWLISDTNVVKPAGTAFTWTYAGKTLTAQYTANTYTITVTAGRGVSALSATGWTNTNTTTITKTLTYNDTVDLSTITATMKDGYTGKAYAISSGAGTLSGASFTVGAGVTTISISATGITTPTASLTSTDTITDTYNAPGSVTITANSVTGYDSGITITYSFGIATYSSSTGCAAFSYGTAGSTNSTTMAKTNHRGYRCVNVKVVASDGTLTSQEAISTHRLVYLVQRRLRFYEDSEYTSKYARYGTQLLYTSATNNTTTSVPTLAAREGYTFNGWWTAATGGSQVIDANGTIKPSISGYTDASSNYILTANKAVYARFVANTISLTWDGASGTPTSCTYGSTFVPPTPEPRVGYVFSGWKVKTTNP